jgi:hypothetical protein
MRLESEIMAKDPQFNPKYHEKEDQKEYDKVLFSSVML